MTFKARLTGGELLRGVIAAIPSAVATQALAAAGADFVMIDCEHAPIGPEALHAMIGVTAGTGCSPLVRVAQIDEGQVKGALDSGAEGIVFPLVRSVADAERCVALVTYPPGGVRGWGPFVAHARHGVALGDYATGLGSEIACGLLIETTEALAEVDAILAVPGVDFAILAPYDLSSALGVLGQFDAPVMVEARRTVEAAARAAGVPLGVPAFTPERAAAAIAAGYQVLLQGLDLLMLSERVAAFRDWG